MENTEKIIWQALTEDVEVEPVSRDEVNHFDLVGQDEDPSINLMGLRTIDGEVVAAMECYGNLIHTIEVRPEWQGQGLGRWLVETITSEYDKVKALGVDFGSPQEKFWEHLNFKRQGRSMVMVWEYEEEEEEEEE